MKRKKAQKDIAKKMPEPGFDGARIFTYDVRVSDERKNPRSVRARPGTFEWRYGRQTADGALYHAGIKFAELWEKAGAASARSVDLVSAGSGAGWKGLPDGRAIAMQDVRQVRLDLGRQSTERLMAYCVLGQTASEIARRYGTPERSMAPVLHEDLRACAIHFNYL